MPASVPALGVAKHRRATVRGSARRRGCAMTTSIPPEFQKDYTWDAIVFSDGATYVCEARRGEARRRRDAGDDDGADGDTR